MASVPSSHLIIFIAAIIVSAGLAGVLVDSAERYGVSVRQSQTEYAKDVNTDIEIINDPGKPGGAYDEVSDTLSIYVKNVGDRIIPSNASEMTVLVNGTQIPIDNAAIHDGDRWRPGDVVELTVTVVLPSNEQTRVVVVVSGDRDHYEFTSP